MHTIEVQIVYALPKKAWIKNLKVARRSTPIDVIQLSQLLDDFPELTLNDLNYGIFSQRINQNYLMDDGDRLEVYRPLTADPKTVRRELARVGKTMADER